ncbi:MAG: hypothetical protein ACRCYO_12335 [Bacteroidia bacterium]
MMRYAYTFFTAFLLLALISCGDPRQRKTKEEKKLDARTEKLHFYQRLGLCGNYSIAQVDSLAATCNDDPRNQMRKLLVKTGAILEIDLSLEKRSCFDTYRNAFKVIGEKWPDLKCDSITLSYIYDTDNKKDTDAVLVNVQLGNESISRQLYWFRGWEMDETFCKLFNTILTERNSPERLHLVTFECDSCSKSAISVSSDQDITRMGIMRLNKQLADSILPDPELHIDPMDEFSILTRVQAETYLSQLLNSGLIEKTDSAKFNEIRTSVRFTSVYGYEGFFEFSDSLFVRLLFDTLNDINPYEEILHNLEKASRGRFITDGFSDERINTTSSNVRFTLHGKTYERTFEMRNGLVSPEIINWVNEALVDQKVDGAFYTIFTREKIAMVTFIKNDKAEQAKASGFFPIVVKGAPDQLIIPYKQ